MCLAIQNDYCQLFSVRQSSSASYPEANTMTTCAQQQTPSPLSVLLVAVYHVYHVMTKSSTKNEVGGDKI